MASVKKVRKIVRVVARRQGVNEDIADVQARFESGYQQGAVSSAGAIGVKQLMPDTARSLGVNPHKLRPNIKGGTKYLKQQLDANGGDYREALAAYAAGPNNKKAGYSYADRVLAAAGQGRKPKSPSATSAGTEPSPGSVTATKTVPGVDRSDDRKALIADYFQTQPRPSKADPYGTRQQGSLLTLAAALKDAQDTPSKTVSSTVKVRGTSSPESGGGSTRGLLERAVAQSKAQRPYQWGGGHGAKPAAIGSAVDCSGYVSQILDVAPRVSGQFARFGKPGAGKRVTLYANDGHVLIEISGRFFATSKSNPGGGAGEIARPSASYLARFTKRHPEGM